MVRVLFLLRVNSCDLGIAPYESINQNFFIFFFRTSILLLLITLQFILNILNLVPPTIKHPNAVLTVTSSPSLPVRYYK